MKPVTVRAAALLAALLVVAAGCWNPTGEAPKAGTEPDSEAHGLVVLQFNDLRSLTITPEISLEIDSYELSFTRSGTEFPPVTLTDLPGEATQSEPVSLLPGAWRVTVSAVNDEGKVIGLGSATVSVISGHTSTVSLPIRSLTGEGTLSLSADVSALELNSPSISGTLKPGDDADDVSVEFDINAEGSTGTLEQDLEAGTYLLSLKLFDGEEQEEKAEIAAYVNSVLIVYEETTSAELVFRPARGTVVAELADEITRPIAITLEGLQESLTPEESMTVSAQTAEAVDYYQWYLDGYLIDGETGQEIILGPGLEEGEYLLTVVVKRGEIYSAEAGEFAVASSLDTYTVTYNPNGGEGDVPEPQTKTHGIDLTLAADSGDLERTGYTFAGWNTLPDGSGQDYAHGDTYTDDAELTLYARWTANTYTVTLLPAPAIVEPAPSVEVTFGSPMPPADAPTRAGYEFAGFYTFTGVWQPQLQDQYYTAAMESARDWDIPEDRNLLADWLPVPAPYQIGDTGPAGGIVFYDKGEYTDGWRYLEVAPASTEWPGARWGGYGTLVGGTGTAIGTGAANTQAIVAAYGDNEPYEDKADYAAKLCADLVYNGYADWFLPSQDELDLMFENLRLQELGDFGGGYYWSSSEDSATHVWSRHFGVGWRFTFEKYWYLEFAVRAVRAF